MPDGSLEMDALGNVCLDEFGQARLCGCVPGCTQWICADIPSLSFEQDCTCPNLLHRVTISGSAIGVPVTIPTFGGGIPCGNAVYTREDCDKSVFQRDDLKIAAEFLRSTADDLVCESLPIGTLYVSFRVVDLTNTLFLPFRWNYVIEETSPGCVVVADLTFTCFDVIPNVVLNPSCTYNGLGSPIVVSDAGGPEWPLCSCVETTPGNCAQLDCADCPPTITMSIDQIVTPVGNGCWFHYGEVQLQCANGRWDEVAPGNSLDPPFGSGCALPDPDCIASFGGRHGQVFGNIQCDNDQWTANILQLHADFPYGDLLSPPCSRASLQLTYSQPLLPQHTCPPSDGWVLIQAGFGNDSSVFYTEADGVNAKLTIT